MKTILSLNPATEDSQKKIIDIGNFIREARLEKGLTQDGLAQKCGTNKAYISKVENGTKDLRFSSLKKIIETGLDGELNITITL